MSIPSMATPDVIFGEYRDHQVVQSFVQALRVVGLDGTLYVGYPVLAVDDARVEFDAVLVSPSRGVVIFDLYGSRSGAAESGKGAEDRLEQRYAALYNKLNSFKELRSGRQLSVPIITVAVDPTGQTFAREGETLRVGLARLGDIPQLSTTERLATAQVSHLDAAIQRISNLRPAKKRENVQTTTSKGARIKGIEAQIANLDLWQKRGSIEYVNGPQRIRGLAGSGKTVVLALKAAYLHVKRPDWGIVVTFNTRSLYQQFEALITRFVYAQVGDEPDWTKLHVMHAWGGAGRTGVYSEAARTLGAPYRDFGTAARMFGYGAAFDGACQELLASSVGVDLEQYDMMLVDEAQDLPASFFRLAYSRLKQPKRIVWAYDDLQNLGDFHMPSEEELFGHNGDGVQLVRLVNEADSPQQDIVLPRSYRNPPWTLVTAHGLGFGTQHQPIVQIFPEPYLWNRLGYRSSNGRALQFDADVSIERSPESVPTFFSEFLTPEETLRVKAFDDRSSQYDAIALEIARLLSEDELQHSDILIVLPDILTSRSVSGRVLSALRKVGLAGHIPGVSSSRDEIFQENSIAITHIHRAKGNEAPVVFIPDADYCEASVERKKRRNVLFTAITRSRAWTYVCGVGPAFATIASEIEAIRSFGYRLQFHYPTQEQAKKLAATSDLPAAMPPGGEIMEDLRKALRKAKEQKLLWDDMPEDVRRDLGAIYGSA